MPDPITIVASIAILIAAALLGLRLAGAKYRALHADDHLIAFAEGALRIRDAALARLDARAVDARAVSGRAAGDGDDPCTMRTAHEVVLYYTIDRVDAAGRDGSESELSHHVSLSYPDSIPAYGIGHQFAAYAVHLWGLPPTAVTLQVSPGRIFHLSFALTEEGHARFAALELAAPTTETVRATWRAAIAARHELPMERMPSSDAG